MSKRGAELTGRPRRAVCASIRAMRLPCWLCHEPIDYDAPARTPRSFTVDEVVPRSKGGSATDPDNLRPAHHVCNSERGAGVVVPLTYRTPASRDW